MSPQRSTLEAGPSDPPQKGTSDFHLCHAYPMGERSLDGSGGLTAASQHLDGP